MRIVLLTNNRLPPREGIGHHVTALARALAARGHAVRLVAAGTGGDFVREELDGLPLLLYPRRGPRPFHHAAVRRALERRLLREVRDADLLHVHLPLLPPLDLPVPVAVTVPTPMLADTAAPRESRLEGVASRLYARLLARRYEIFWLRRAARVFAVSSRVAAELVRDYPLPRPPVVLPNGVDLDAFPWPPPERREPVVLYVGRLGPRKGLLRLLHAFALLGRPELRLVLLGEGSLRPRLEAEAARLGLGRRVVFAGFADRATVARALARCRVFVLPSTYEGMPLALLEAMAAGAPVVTTPACRLPEFGADPPFLVAEDGDPRALARALADLLDSPDRARGLMLRARALVERRFTWARVAAALEAALASPPRAAA